MISISENAAVQIQKLKKDESRGHDHFLRVRVVGGGCSGLTYKMEFDNQISDSDKVFENHDVKVVTDSKSYLYLLGTELDYSGGLNGKGFVFENPNAKKSCGCGTSFSVG
ncbi:MAG: iron-sulfur cluster insertion protein ErpA [Bdellovibrionales bacterium CG10_big_fil_rev_8_21_14_0_10_45_34]|nr:MAG: iron-sulfur cluster insertion protein ErpA [Bdellovibrionales bacterium CG10_big_fil_rev_8_21_14_0_10_45_34]